MELERLHADALAEVIRQLRACAEVAVLVPEQVFGPDELTQAEEWGRCVVVTPGRNFGDAPNSPAGPLLPKRGAVVEIRAENGAALAMLASAVYGQLHGAAAKVGFQHCNATREGMTGDGDGFVWAKMVFVLACVPKGDAQSASAPPRTVRRLPPAAVPKRGG